METEAIKIVEKMFTTFASGDLEKFGETISDDTLWIYHGTTEIPKSTFEGNNSATNYA